MDEPILMKLYTIAGHVQHKYVHKGG